MKFLKGITEDIKHAGFPTLGSTNKEIEAIQLKLGVEFPMAYKEFLQVFGEESEVLFCGHTIACRHLEFIQEEGKRVYQEALAKPVPDNIFFIFEHQVYSFYYFYLDGDENPDLYLLIHGDDVTNKQSGKIIDLVKSRFELNSKWTGTKR